MLFNSFHFLLFFFLVFVLYFVLPHKFRWILLLIASYYFYMCWRPELIILIIFSTLMNYFISLLIYKEKNEKQRKKYLIISLIINFGLLFIFKYFIFLNQTFMELYTAIINFIFTLTGHTPLQTTELLKYYPLKNVDIILPMGISFYTFQAASYTIDVYRKKIKPVRHYGIFSLFITFFPQLVAGPIERSENLLPQFFVKHKFHSERILSGLKLMLLGYFKKIVIADRAAVAVNTVFNSPYNYSGLYYVFATLLFTFQLYCDFSGYSDIAVGSAKVLGFDLMMNFDKPYLSKSIKEFWRRWHISLSSWFMDYVYIPLGGNRNGKAKQYRNLMITFLVSGLWHGSNWTYVIWGGIHGLYQLIGIATSKIRNSIKRFFHLENSSISSIISILITFSLVSFALIFFRANTIYEALYITKNLFDNFTNWTDKQYLYEVITGMGSNLYELKVVVFSIFILIISEIISGKKSVFDFWERKPYIFRLAFYVLIGAVILTTGVYYNAGEFIYFQF